MRIRELDAADIDRIGEVDRSELVVAEYLARPTANGLGLHLERVGLEPPQVVGPWTSEDIAHRVKLWQPEIDAGGCFFAVEEETQLKGFAILGPVAPDRSVELCALFVDAGCRRTGIGFRLLEAVEAWAREHGAGSLWCGSNRTESAVRFYITHGFCAIGVSDNSLVPHRLGDPVLAKPL